VEIVAIVISAIGLFFAARAAAAARETVQLTKEIRQKDDVRRVLQALTGVQRAAHALTLLPPGARSSDLEDRFFDAQTQLAQSMPIDAELPLPDDARGAFDRLFSVKPYDDPARTTRDAAELWNGISWSRQPETTPPWHRLLTGRSRHGLDAPDKS
jgi:hypothetical protein